MFAAMHSSLTTFISCGAWAGSTRRAPLTASTSLSPLKYVPTPDRTPSIRANMVVPTPPAGVPKIAYPIAEPEQAQQQDDEARHQQRVASVGGLLVVERSPGHGPSRGRSVSSG